MSDDPEDPKDLPDAKFLSEFSDEELTELMVNNPIGFQIALQIGATAEICFMAGVPREELHRVIDKLYDAVSAKMSKGAN